MKKIQKNICEFILFKFKKKNRIKKMFEWKRETRTRNRLPSLLLPDFVDGSQLTMISVMNFPLTVEKF